MSGKGPLEGIRVVAFGSFIAGPFAGQVLADMGADVIKVEPPAGDPWRHQNPVAENESRVFLPVNRGVRSICLDLKSGPGRAAIKKLIGSSDAVISNTRTDTAQRLGIDYESLSAKNPRLVYVEITAYGPKGPRADMPGFDLIMQGYSGAIANEGKLRNNQPEPVWSSSFIDFSTAYSAAGAVMAGLLERARTGKGQKATTSLLANATAMQCLRLVRINEIPSPTQKWFDEELPKRRADGASYSELQDEYQERVRPLEYQCYYRAYRTKDGGLALGTLAVHARLRLLDALGLKDPRFQDPDLDATPAEVERAGRELIVQMESIFATRTTEEWFEYLRSRDIPCEPVRFIEELVDDEQSLANSYVIELEHPAGFSYKTSGPIIQFENGMPDMRPSPTLGQHTAEILTEIGMSEADQSDPVG